ncbi:hypothetical protein PACTADRAFT_75390 [Pachysolen tannophilus NRRL Y-2460]|uniref:Uroporphyrinogen decarboxylase (URO-D) domain-containing protein n=1 Tax=Pachysolen tannophilus NRRL Y-2460 TaxID=669874 RepID=A0A1E4TWW6_PACTA|nr:hypothetical protein PACTADRAFT_75390 [Pachysolen tannophilus NRRL Y-2460]
MTSFDPYKRPPVWIMRQAGRYLPEYHEVKGGRDFFETCRDAEIASEITIQPIEHFEGLIDAAIIFSDILVIPQAMGMEVEMIEKQGPHFVDPLRKPEDLLKLNEKVDIEKELVPLLGFCGGPWTLLVYMVEGGGSKLFRFAKEWIYKYTKEAHVLLQKITDVAIDFLAHQVKAGAQMLQVFESWGGELGPNEFNEFSLPYLKQISSWYALDNLCDSGYSCVSLDWLYKPEDAVALNNGRVTLQGNLDPSLKIKSFFNGANSSSTDIL